MGLIWSMQPSGPAPAGAYFWNEVTPLTFTATVTVHGRRGASTTFQRSLTDVALANHSESLAENGFVGRFSAPMDTTMRHAAVLVIGGSGGGLPFPLLLEALADHGLPTLGVAYFGEPGLPKTLSNIPLEYSRKRSSG